MQADFRGTELENVEGESSLWRGIHSLWLYSMDVRKSVLGGHGKTGINTFLLN